MDPWHRKQRRVFQLFNSDWRSIEFQYFILVWSSVRQMVGKTRTQCCNNYSMLLWWWRFINLGSMFTYMKRYFFTPTECVMDLDKLTLVKIGFRLSQFLLKILLASKVVKNNDLALLVYISVTLCRFQCMYKMK